MFYTNTHFIFGARRGSASILCALFLWFALESVSFAEVQIKLKNGRLMKFATVCVRAGRLECKLTEGTIYLTPDQLSAEERVRYFPDSAPDSAPALSVVPVAAPKTELNPGSVVSQPEAKPAVTAPASATNATDPAPYRPAVPEKASASRPVSPIKQKGGFFYSFSQSPKIHRKNPDVDYSFQMDQEKFYIYVPKQYDGSKAFGLVVFINSKDIAEIPWGWDAVMNERNLLFIAPQNIGDDDTDGRRVGLAVVAALKMMEEYKVDSSRVYVAGQGEGGRMAARVAFQHPELLRGCFACSGAEFYKPVKWGGSNYGVFAHATDLVGAAKRNVRFVLITGETDVHRDEILDLYYGGFVKDGLQAKLFDVPASSQGVFSANVLSHGLEFVDTARRAR